jgi:hypothetical protein
MRALVIGVMMGLLLGLSITLVLLSSSMSMTGAAITSTGETITLPANAQFGSIDTDLRIVNGRIDPKVVRIDTGVESEISILAITGPARILIPQTGQSTPMLSDRQKHTFFVRIDEPGDYEIICRPCGTEQSLEAALLIVS